MRVNYQRGYVSGLAISFIMVLVLLVSVGSFALWAYTSRQDYKNNSDQKAAAAAAASKQAAQDEDAKAYAEAAKSPLKSYTGPASFGNVTVQYPKTWSGYIVQNDRGGLSQPIDAYFHPNYVPNVSDTANAFALRVQLLQQSYDTSVRYFDGLVRDKKVSIAPFKLAKVPSVVGVRVDGSIDGDKQGSMIILPVRNLTLKVYTQSPQFKGDFDTYILPNLSFSP